MKSSLIRSGAAAIVAALAFAACAGNGSVPSSSGPANSNLLRTVAPSAATNPCPIPVGWAFGGPCDPIPLATTGATGSLPAYKGFALKSTLGTNNAKKGTYLVFQDATGKGDITGTVAGMKFPKDKHAFLYLAALNTSKKGFNFNSTPAITITSKAKIKGKACSLDKLGFNSSNTALVWTPSGITGSVAKNGKSVAFASLPVSQTIPAGTSGPFYLAFSCK